MIDSDAVTVDLKMPMGTNVKVTDSIISVIENHAIEIGREFEEKYMQDDNRALIEHIQKILVIQQTICLWSKDLAILAVHQQHH